MKIVILERASVGLDVSVDMFQEIGEVEIYNNTPYKEIAKRVENADIIIANKSKLNEETLKNALNVKLICEFARPSLTTLIQNDPSKIGEMAGEAMSRLLNKGFCGASCCSSWAAWSM